jgi:hypothetical protein
MQRLVANSLRRQNPGYDQNIYDRVDCCARLCVNDGASGWQGWF